MSIVYCLLSIIFLKSSSSSATLSTQNATTNSSPRIKPNIKPISTIKTEHDRYVLDTFTQCSKSHLWKLMMSFYDRKGPESWSQGR